MRLGRRRAGTSIAFVDTTTDEVLFRVSVDQNGRASISFRLYDSNGCLVAESGGLRLFTNEIRIQAEDGELLLEVPAEPHGDIQYRFYSRSGKLITCSDGVTTRIHSSLRMELEGGARPSRSQQRPSG